MRRGSCLSIACLLVAGLAGTVQAQSPREQLGQLVAQLRASPGDGALRERIIRLALEIKPAPAVPEEAERRMARGVAGFQGARSQDEYRIAAREFQAAADAAPWLADAYFNLGMSLDKAGDFAAAVGSLRLALLANPERRETKNLLYQVEFRQEQMNSPAAQAAKKREQEDALVGALNGASFTHEFRDARGTVTQRFFVDVRARTATYRTYLIWAPNEVSQFTCQLKQLGCDLVIPYPRARHSLDFSADGRRVTSTEYVDNVIARTFVLERRR